MELSDTVVMTSGEKVAALSLASLFSLRMLGLFMVLPVFSLYGGGLKGADPGLVGFVD